MNENDQDVRLEKELAGLRQQYERLQMERVRTEQNLANLEQQMAELKGKAESEFGTADVAELEKILAERRAENARLVASYREHIQGIQHNLAELEKDSQ